MTQDRKEVADVRGVDPWGLRRVERLLHTVEGVDSLKIVPDGHGGIDEIHVISSTGLGAKQIVRNIESALLAQFGLQVDHRKISIAQIKAPRDPSPELTVAQAAAEPLQQVEPPAVERRLILEEFHIERSARERVLCRVKLRHGDEVFAGEAEGPDYAKSRLETAAQATLNSLAAAIERRATCAIEGVTEIELFGSRMVIAVVQGFEGRHPVALPGISTVGDSLEESVVYACLSATNRWLADL